MEVNKNMFEYYDELPKPYMDVMIEFEKTRYIDIDGKRKTEIVKKRGFYSDSLKKFFVPDSYSMFNGRLLPHGFGHTALKKEEVISWTKIN
jgi:hypothetical protein